MCEIWKPIIINEIDTGYKISSLRRVKNRNEKVLTRNKFSIYKNGKRFGCSINNLYNLNFIENKYFYYEKSNKVYISLEELMSLKWSPIKGFDDYYISIYGIIKSTKNNKNYFICREPHICNGYVYVTIKNEGNYTFRLHKLVMMTFSHREKESDIINHINGCKFDNRLENLEFCSKSDNMIHAIKTGLIADRTKSSLDRDKLQIIDGEIWKGALFYNKEMKLIDFSKNYEVSTFGRIRNKKGTLHHGKVTKDGYHLVTLRLNGIRWTVNTHRVVASTFIENLNNNNNIVDHINRDRMDNNYLNLRWCNHQFNSKNREVKKP
jgi:hypothetical protein